MASLINEYQIELILSKKKIIRIYDLINRVELKNFHDKLLEDSLAKLFVVKTEETFEFVGTTFQSINKAINTLLKSNDNSDHNRNDWLSDYKIQLSVFCLNDCSVNELNYMEAELVFLIKKVTDTWPNRQNEIHAKNIRANSKDIVQRIFSSIYSFNMSTIFANKPDNWGSRGNPFLWDDMAASIKQKPVPTDVLAFYHLIIDEITQLAGQPLARGKNLHLRKYDHGGMSSGIISSDFWFNDEIPRLLKLFLQFNV